MKPIGCSSRSSKRDAAYRALAIRRRARQWQRSRSCSATAGFSAASSLQHLDTEEEAVMLAAEDVGVDRAAARVGAADCEFDRQRRIELDVIGDAGIVDTEDAAHRGARQDSAVPHMVVIGAGGEDHVEGDPVDPGILAADRLGDFGEWAARHQTPASVTKVGNSSSGSSSRKVWLIVQR